MKNRAFLSENTTKKMTDDQVKPFKVIVFGEAGVGKSGKANKLGSIIYNYRGSDHLVWL